MFADAAPLDLVMSANVSACDEGVVNPAVSVANPPAIVEEPVVRDSSPATTSRPSVVECLLPSPSTSPKTVSQDSTVTTSPTKQEVVIDIASPAKNTTSLSSPVSISCKHTSASAIEGSPSRPASISSQSSPAHTVGSSPSVHSVRTATSVESPEATESTFLAHESPAASPAERTIRFRADEVAADDNLASVARSPSKSPVSKAGSVCSITFSLPDSPGPHTADPIPEPASTPPQPIPPADPSLTASRRSERIARRRSIESIPDTVAVGRPVSKSRASRKRSISSIAEAAVEHDEDDDDDAGSIKSGFSLADSVTSRASSGSSRSVTSNQSQKRRRSYSRLELRESWAKPRLKELEVIHSDEEMTLPTKSEVVASSSRRSSISQKVKYAASEPDSRRTRGSRSECGSDDERLSSVSEAAVGTKTSRRLKRSQLNMAMLKTPSPMRKQPLKKLICSTPVTMTKVGTFGSTKSRCSVR